MLKISIEIRNLYQEKSVIYLETTLIQWQMVLSLIIARIYLEYIQLDILRPC